MAGDNAERKKETRSEITEPGFTPLGMRTEAQWFSNGRYRRKATKSLVKSVNFISSFDSVIHFDNSCDSGNIKFTR